MKDPARSAKNPIIAHQPSERAARRREQSERMGTSFRSRGTNLRLLVNHSVRVFLLGCIILGLCQRDVFLSLQKGRLPLELLKAWRGKKTATARMSSLPKLSTEIQGWAGMKTVEPPWTSLVVTPTCTRAVPLSRNRISSAPGCLGASMARPGRCLRS